MNHFVSYKKIWNWNRINKLNGHLSNIYVNTTPQNCIFWFSVTVQLFRITQIQGLKKTTVEILITQVEVFGATPLTLQWDGDIVTYLAAQNVSIFILLFYFFWQNLMLQTFIWLCQSFLHWLLHQWHFPFANTQTLINML